jgi:flavin reductase (DIM6/NTAB) family NADH-FMN oxidoreductase RutF
MSSTVDPNDYRNTIGLFATGVTIVAAEIEGELQTLTANALTSVSLDPLLLLVCVGNKNDMSHTLGKSDGFTFNILREEQQALSSYFADMWAEGEPPPAYEFVTWEGVPRLEGCIASIRCVPHQVLDGGDHQIVIGRVVALHMGEEPYNPLLFYAGRYGRLVSA